MQLVETIEVGAGGAASIEFTSIPQDADDLVMLISSRRDTTSYFQTLKFNNDTGSNYSYRELLGTGSSASSSSASAFLYVKLLQNQSSTTSNTFSNSSIYIPNYTSSAQKSVSIDSVTENNATAAEQGLYAGLWSGTAAITSIQIGGANMVQYSTFSLYKITKAA